MSGNANESSVRESWCVCDVCWAGVRGTSSSSRVMRRGMAREMRVVRVAVDTGGGATYRKQNTSGNTVEYMHACVCPIASCCRLGFRGQARTCTNTVWGGRCVRAGTFAGSWHPPQPRL